MWNVYTGEILNSLDLPAEVKFVKMMPDGQRLVVSCNLGNIFVVDMLQNTVVNQMKTEVKE